MNRKNDRTDAQDKGKPGAADFQEAGQRAVLRIVKGFLSTWKLYRQSKTGVAGLSIALGFLVVAIFAPWLAPYDKDFKAPAIDTFIADYASRNLTAELNWSKILGLTSRPEGPPPREGPGILRRRDRDSVSGHVRHKRGDRGDRHSRSGTRRRSTCPRTRPTSRRPTSRHRSCSRSTRPRAREGRPRPCTNTATSSSTPGST